MAGFHRPLHEHRAVNGGWLRPTVFGAMDGLVSNFALIAGVAGGQADPDTVVLAGLAGLAAGAFSMSVGEYTSVASQAELAEAEIAVERAELAQRPHAELRELTELYISRGVEPELAQQVAEQLSKDPDQALKIHTQEELGVDLHNLPSPKVAAVSSFLSFAVGALLPVLPYLLGATSLWPALIVALLGLFGCGALVSRITARSWWYSGLRQLLLGAASAGLTYLIGSAVGAGLS
ncbi:MAG: VIT1/CCC1 transporter family protein [Sporichthyaceae bacterium]|nr:VIT1/CCC1 transporter family protein [Sporichthyaceae bacterium]